MKKRWGREIGLLSLPVLLIAGGALWKSGTSNWWSQTNRSHIKIVKSYAFTRPPYDVAEDIERHDTDIVIWTEEQIPVWLRGTQYLSYITNPNHSAGQLPEIKGKSGNAIVTTTMSYGRGRGWASTSWWLTSDFSAYSPFHIEMNTLRVPKKVGEIRVTGTFVAKNLPPTPFSVVARPAWMTHKATKLRVTDVQWRPARKGNGGAVEVGLLYTGKKPFGLRGVGANGWEPRYLSAGPISLVDDTSKDEIIAHWSQHIESGDGKYHSLHELESQEVDISASAKVGQSYDPQGLANKFEPRVLPLRHKISGNRVRVVFNVTSLPKTIKNPVFKAEMGVAGDGFIPISCKLPRPIS